MLINLVLKRKIKKQPGRKLFIIPKPQNTFFQKIIFEKILSVNPTTFKEKKFYNQFYYLSLKNIKNTKSIYYLALLKLNKRKTPIKINTFWLEKNRFINPYNPQIQKFARKLKKHNDLETIKQSFKFTVEKLKYDAPIKGLYRLENALEVFSGKRKGVDCGGFSVFLISLLRSLKIPSRLAVGFVIRQKFLKVLHTLRFSFLTQNSLYMHAWVETFSKEKGIISIDPSVEWRRKKGLTRRESFKTDFF
ncbi:MAG TPA: transglutaminase domain-containing protein, partial [Armatimonadetes bacterium]|nr:transglutaminase domain-containing protein [Armatimonadota bacterium]